jgi:hypothetical protein
VTGNDASPTQIVPISGHLSTHPAEPPTVLQPPVEPPADAPVDVTPTAVAPAVSAPSESAEPAEPAAPIDYDPPPPLPTGWLARWARWILRRELLNYQAVYYQQHDRIDVLERRIVRDSREAKRSIIELRRQRDEQRLIADGTVRSRLERELLATWADLADRFDSTPTDADAPCTKVPLHNRNEVARFIAQIQRETGYPEPLHGYRCERGCRHPLVGRVLHVGHPRGHSALRNLTGSQRAELRRREPLTQPLAPELLRQVREAIRRRDQDQDQERS